ncbi:hypothetical protein AB0K12_20330 [Nonomuraea sp. NPDC049419]
MFEVPKRAFAERVTEDDVAIGPDGRVMELLFCAGDVVTVETVAAARIL